MFALNITPHPVRGSPVAGKWRISCVREKSSDFSNREKIFIRADHFSAVQDYISKFRDGLCPVNIELVGVYYYELFFDLEDSLDQADLPFDLSVFLYCLYRDYGKAV